MVISARRAGLSAPSSLSLLALGALAFLALSGPRRLLAADRTAAAASASSASSPIPAADAAARVEHVPLITAPRGRPLRVTATLRDADKLTAAYVVYLTETSGGLRQAALRRSGVAEGWLAEIPTEHLTGATLGYAIEGRLADGAPLALFGSREDLQRVQLQEDPTDARENALLARLGGRRSVVASTFDYVSFGSRFAPQDGSPTPVTGSAPQMVTSPDRYFRAEAGYTYRVLRDIAEFGLRIGVVRGTSPGRDREVGLNYGSPHLRVRAAPFLHFEGSLLTGITEVGFAFGAGGLVHLGEPYGTKLVLGFEAVEVFGTRGYSRLDVSAPLGFTLSPMVEITDMPHATATGVRLLLEATRVVSQGLTLTARGGYQARDEATGGPTLGLGAAYAF